MWQWLGYNGGTGAITQPAYIRFVAGTASSTGSTLYYPPSSGWVTDTQPTAATIYNSWSWYQAQMQEQQQAAMAQAFRPATPAIMRRQTDHEELEFYLRNEIQHAAELKKHNEDAAARALALLEEHLTPAQRKTMKENQWFIVEGGKTKKKYRINGKGTLVANIDVLVPGLVEDNKEAKASHRICCHSPLNAAPYGDQLLAQKLMLELDEDTFIRLANVHPARRVA